MPEQKEQRDLLKEWASVRESLEQRDKIVRWGAVGIYLTAAVMETLITKHSYLLLAGFATVGAVAALSICLLYGAFIFFLAWHYAAHLISAGQTRMKIRHFAAMAFMTGFVPGIFLIVKYWNIIRIDFAATAIITLWTTFICAFLGYGSRFLAKTELD